MAIPSRRRNRRGPLTTPCRIRWINELRATRSALRSLAANVRGEGRFRAVGPGQDKHRLGPQSIDDENENRCSVPSHMRRPRHRAGAQRAKNVNRRTCNHDSQDSWVCRLPCCRRRIGLGDQPRSYREASARSVVARCLGLGSESVRSEDRKSTRLNSSHIQKSRMPSSA